MKYLAPLLLFQFILSFAFSLEKENVNFHRNVSKMKKDECNYSRTKLLLDKAIKEATQKIQQHFLLHCCGVGMRGDLSYVSLEFECKRPLSIDEARAVLIESVDIFQQTSNKYLDSECSINAAKNKVRTLGITLFLSDEDYNSYAEPFVCVAKLNSTRYIFRFKSKNQKIGYKETIEETLEEAEEKNRAYLEKLNSKQDPEL